jgi:hypothetical protein
LFSTHHILGRFTHGSSLGGHEDIRLAFVVRQEDENSLAWGEQTHLGIHPEMERPAILNRSMPSTAAATISHRASLFAIVFRIQRKYRLMIKNVIYSF